MTNNHALLIGVENYQDPRFKNLGASTNDVLALRNLLIDPNIGGFNAPKITGNADGAQLRQWIHTFLKERKPADKVLLYYSGHGLTDDSGDLYFCVPDTLPDNPEGNSISADYLRSRLEDCAAERIIVILDCCYAGAFSNDYKDGSLLKELTERPRANIVEGKGLFVFMSSSKDQRSKTGDEYSLYTKHIIEGIISGKAAEGKEYISVADLGRYLSENVYSEVGKKQIPQISQIDAEFGDVYIAKNPMRLTDRVPPVKHSPNLHRHPKLLWTVVVFVSVIGVIGFIVANNILPCKVNIGEECDQLDPYGIPIMSWIDGEPGEAGSSFRDLPDTPEMVVLPMKSFNMGSPPSETPHPGSEAPIREVNIERSFALGRYEVTIGEWRAFVESTGYTQGNDCRIKKFQKDDYENTGSWKSPGFGQNPGHPVVCVNWDDAKLYVEWLNDRTESDLYRLPSEAEWEYAARANTSTARYWGDDAANTDQCTYANGADKAYGKFYGPFEGYNDLGECDDGFAETSPHGYFGENEFGISDLLGNVAEWTEDCAHSDYINAPIDGTAWLAGDGGSCRQRVLRGGAWSWGTRMLRSGSRLYVPLNSRNDSVGLRVARTLISNRK